MEKNKSYFIEMLDRGAVLKVGNSKMAYETTVKLEEKILTEFLDAISALHRGTINNLVINFSVTENVPMST